MLDAEVASRAIGANGYENGCHPDTHVSRRRTGGNKRSGKIK